MNLWLASLRMSSSMFSDQAYWLPAARTPLTSYSSNSGRGSSSLLVTARYAVQPTGGIMRAGSPGTRSVPWLAGISAAV